MCNPYFTVQKALPLLSPGSSIVLTTSVINVKGLPGSSVYASTKAALRSLVRTFAAELSPKGIRVNAVSPGPIDTPIPNRLGLPAEAVAEMSQQLMELAPLKRMGNPEEIANSIKASISAISQHLVKEKLSDLRLAFLENLGG